MNSRFIFGLLAGIAVGAAAVYFANSTDKEELMDDLKDLANKTKDKLAEKLRGLEPADEAIEEYGI